MNEAIDFIKNFKPYNFGFGIWDIPVFIGSVILSLVIFNIISKILPSKIQPYFSKIGNWIFWLFAGSFLFLMFLKAIFTKDYWVIFILCVFLIPIFTRIKNIDDLFKMYDDFVDKRIIGK